MIRRPPRSTPLYSSAASDVYKRQGTKRLIDVLRNEIGLTGTKEGCGEGECGACTVLLNGDPVNSCLVLAGQLNDVEIVTIEGLSEAGSLNLLQDKFLEAGAVQCGFCSPGMIMVGYALLTDNPKPVSYTHLRAHETKANLVCRLLLEKQ